MNPLRRIAATLNLSIESFLDQVENHEAVAACAIREIKRAAGKARIQYHRVKQDLDRVTKRLDEAEEEKRRWADRARTCHKLGDEGRAMECVRRLRSVEREITQLTEEKKQNEKLVASLTTDLRRIEEKVEALKRKRNTLASRQANADALKVMDACEAGSAQEIDEIFERWEARIAGAEAVGHFAAGADSFESEFTKEEDDAETRAKLDEIVRRETK